MITCEHLTIHTSPASQRPALRDVSTRIERGRVRAIVGGAGAGKTVLGRALVGLLDSGLGRVVGRVRIGDRLISLRLNSRNPHLRAAWFGVKDLAQLPPARSVRELLADAVAARFPAEVFDDLTLASALARVGYNDERLLDADPTALAPAELRRVLIARALARPVTVQAPDLVVLDEPLAGLDPQSATEVLAALTGMRRAVRASVVVLTRDLQLAKEYADEISVLEGGRLVETFSAERLHAVNVSASGDTKVSAVRQASTPRAGACETALASAAKRVQAPSETAAGRAAAALELRDFSVLLPEGSPVTSPISVSVEAGEGLAITGPAGSGKRAIARALVGAIHPSSALRIGGDLLLGGELQAPRVAARTPAQRRAIQLVVHDLEHSPNDSHTVRTQLRRAVRRARPQAASRAISARVAELMRMVELDEGLLLERTGDLPYEAARRTALARALAHEPRVLVCDDSGAEDRSSREALDVLARVREETGVVLVMITGSSDVARYTCSRELELVGNRAHEFHDFALAGNRAA